MGVKRRLRSGNPPSKPRRQSRTFAIRLRSMDSQKPSFRSVVSSVKYCSITWFIASAHPAAVCLAETEKVYSGSRMEKTGNR